ncbi:ABC transporter ATP-binding protein/permease [Campylobacter hyointestinalis]|uniref:ABC transporter ATP-binding protein/permease n=1 Tax=Campylobacter hyointestinalis TaxID=198 RepID=UPI000CE470E9|nr:ABC transporter ATP-binding protein [Campylobacter hyointestinalis]PPB53521.1 ABC transporter ATP-binding protein [Campylobacter hyointestinalis subsp. hyointestinalis]PPB66250.1 ABC transporter ATP-binding protein [Campylobacter hyointestinalis subsp. hyointestinalis]PPB70958.1 ABC transporter ATP-binding protein [Campylobacter hyointestinalis subsp. hyointestinalis]
MLNIKRLRHLLSRKDKIYLIVLFMMSIIMSVIEIIGISAIMPFIVAATDPAKITTNKYFAPFYEFFGFKSEINFILAFGFLIIGFYLFRAVFSLAYTYVLNRFAFGCYHIFASRLFSSYIGLTYKDFVSRNSSQFIKAIISEAGNLTTYIQQLLSMSCEFFTILLFYIMLLIVDCKMTLVLSVVLGFIVWLTIKFISNNIKKQGQKRNYAQGEFYKILNESFGNFKLIKLIQNEDKILDNFGKFSLRYARSNIINATLNALPKNILETFGLSILVLIVVFILIVYKDAGFILPIISMYALALYRILPSLNRLLISYNQMLFYRPSLEIIYEELSYIHADEGNDNINFEQKIELKDINFEYIASNSVLHDVSLSINKGEKIAFVGQSGSGKSTLVDIIIGIYKPTSGEILIDGVKLDDVNIRSWRQKIGYIPQSIYLFDGTVKENVAFGYELDESKVIKCLKKANIYEFLQEKQGIDTLVGEGGIRLSGGQKQRIGIARALYNDPEILVLDEATSALDNDTEAKIMDEIYRASQNKTLIIIAHRLSTVEKCERKIKLNKGKME